MFRGVFEASLDVKGRTSLPAKFRETLVETFGDDRFFITNSVPVPADGGASCSGLVIYPHSEWQDLEERLLKNDGFTSLQRDSIIRLIVAPAVPSSSDKLGRMLIPPSLRKNAGLERDIVFVGALKKIELWDGASWDKVTSRAQQVVLDSQAIADLGL